MDPYWSNVVLLCQFDGTDAATSSTDDSASGHTLTFNGDAQLDTAIKKYGTAALLLDGTGDYVSCGDSADFDFGSGDFCIEFDYYGGGTEPGSSFMFCSNWDTTGNQQSWRLQYDVTNNAIYFWFSTTGSDNNTANFDLDTDGAAGGAADLFDSTFHHIAVVRTGSTIAVHFDGVPGAGTDTSNPTLYTNTSINTLIGAESSGGGIVSPTPGSIDNFRITKGNGRYRAGVAFRPPVRKHELGTSTIDEHWADVKVLITSEDGADGDKYFHDYSLSSNPVYPYGGNGQVDTAVAKFGTRSLLIGDTASTFAIGADGSSSELAVGSSDFTFDWWYYRASEPIADGWLFVHGDSTPAPDQLGYGLQYFRTDNAWRWWWTTTGTFSTPAGVYDLDTDGASLGVAGFFNSAWHHMALVRSNGTVMLFIDGVGKVLETGNTNTLWAPTSARPFTLGGIPAASTGGLGCTGSIDDFRFTLGVARYHADFTAPTVTCPQADGSEVTSTEELSLPLSNPGAESGNTSGWTSSTNLAVKTTAPTPRTGSYYFQASSDTATAYAYQDIDVSYYATDIDAGDAYVDLYFDAASSSGADTGYVEIDFLNGSNVSQGTVQTIEFASHGQNWCKMRIPKTLIPSTTRTLRIGMYGNRSSGVPNDAYFDTFDGTLYSETAAPVGGGGTVTTIVIM